MNKLIRIILILALSLPWIASADDGGSYMDFLNGFGQNLLEMAKGTNTNGAPATDDPMVNNLLNILSDNSKSDEERVAAAKELAQILEEDDYAQKIVDEVNALGAKITDGTAELGDALLNLTKDLTIANAKEKLGKYIGKENADKIADYAQKVADGELSLEDAMNEGLGDLINDVLPPGTADAAKEFFYTIAEGEGFGEFTGSLGDLLAAGAKDGVASLLAKSGLSKEQQDKVMAAAENACNGDWDKVWDNAKDGVGDYLGGVVTDLFGEEAGNAAKDVINGLLNGDESFLNKGVDAATTLLNSELEKKIGAQLDKLAEKFPVLGQIFDALGLDGGSIMEGIANCWNAIKDGKLAEMMSNLISKIADAINNLVEKLKNFIQDFVSNLMNTITDFVSGLINDLIDSITGVVKAALGSFVKSITNLKNQLADASGYFLGNDGGSGATLIDKINQLNNTQQKNVFKSQGGN